MKPMKYGYARVSTVQQDTALQRAAFKKAGVTRVTEEKRSGGAARPLLEALLQRLKPGDVLCVYKTDRLARSLVDLLRILQRVADAGAAFQSLTEPLETATPVGRMMLQLLGAVAEFERAVIRERCAAGREAAVDRGVVFGARAKLRRSDVLALRRAGASWREIAYELKASRAACRKAASGVRRCDGGPGEHVERARRSAPRCS